MEPLCTHIHAHVRSVVSAVLIDRWQEELSLQEALKLAVRVLSMTMDSTALTAEKCK